MQRRLLVHLCVYFGICVYLRGGLLGCVGSAGVCRVCWSGLLHPIPKLVCQPYQSGMPLCQPYQSPESFQRIKLCPRLELSYLDPFLSVTSFQSFCVQYYKDHNECFVSGGFISCTKMEPGKKSQLNVKFRVKLTSRETSPLPDKLFHIFSWSQKCFIFSPWGRVWRF